MNDDFARAAHDFHNGSGSDLAGLMPEPSLSDDAALFYGDDEDDDGFHNKAAADAVHELTERFGKPECDHCKVWHNVAGFTSVQVKDEAIAHDDHTDFVYGTRPLGLRMVEGVGVINGKTGSLAPSLVGAFARLSPSIGFDLLKGEVWARCGSLDAVAKTLGFVGNVVNGDAKAVPEAYHAMLKSEDLPKWYTTGEEEEEDELRLF